jgi:hypothetical protein
MSDTVALALALRMAASKRGSRVFAPMKASESCRHALNSGSVGRLRASSLKLQAAVNAAQRQRMCALS